MLNHLKNIFSKFPEQYGESEQEFEDLPIEAFSANAQLLGHFSSYLHEHATSVKGMNTHVQLLSSLKVYID